MKKVKKYQNGGKLTYEDWKKAHNLKESSNYNLRRAYELGYEPIDGHLPSVDDQTGDFLKLKGHPTLFKEIQQWQLNPQLNKSIFPSMREDGNLKYNPRQEAQWGNIIHSMSEGLHDIKKNISERVYNAVKPSIYEDPKGNVDAAIRVLKGHNRFNNKEYEDLRSQLKTADEKGDSELANNIVDQLERIGYNKYGEDDQYSEDGWLKYLGLDQKNGTFSPSEYRPSKGKNSQSNYYRLPDDFDNDFFEVQKQNNFGLKGHVNESLFPAYNGDNKSRARVLGNFTVDSGQDEKGHYISYYDKYDLSPELPYLGEVNVDKFIGQPFEIYNRIYYDPETKERIKFQDGGVIKDNNGYWNPDNWGKAVEIDSNQITMKGVDQPLLGVSDTGDVQYMEPGREYIFEGKKVTEFPINYLPYNINNEDMKDPKKAQWGGVTASSLMPKNTLPSMNLPEGIQGIYQSLPQSSAGGGGFNLSNFLGQNIGNVAEGFNKSQVEGGPSVAQGIVGQFGPWGAAISAASQIGTSLTDKSNSAVVGGLGTAIFDPASIWTNPDLKGGKKIIGGLIAPLGGYWAAKARIARRDQQDQLSELQRKAMNLNPEQEERRYVRPEDMVTSGNELYPSYGVGTNVLANGGNVMKKGGSLSYNQALDGDLTPLWGGDAETVSYNPYLPGNGETVMFKGNSHSESDGKGNTGIGINYGKSIVEVEGGEPALQLENGTSGNKNLVVYGNIKINNEYSSLLGDPEAKGKKFKNYVADLSEEEAKSSKLLDNSLKEIDDMEVITPIDRLKFNAMQANTIGSKMRLKEIAEKKTNAAMLQSAINDIADEKGKEPNNLEDGGIIKLQGGGGVTYDEEGLEYINDKDYDYLVSLYQRAMQEGEGPAVENFQREFSRLSPNRATKVLANHPVTNYGKARGMTNAELQSNFDAIFGKRTKEYRPEKAREVSDLPIPTGDPATSSLPDENSEKSEFEKVDYKRSPVLDALNYISPFLRPSNKEELDKRQLAGEMYALTNNQLEPVQAQQYSPQLGTPYDVSLRDILNENRAETRAAQRMYGYNPAAQSILSAGQYDANQKVLGEEFRLNQAMRDQVYSQNRDTLNDAQLKNLSIRDQQYQRQSQAKTNTKAVNQAAFSSIADKYLQNQTENRTLQVYENFYGFRYTPDFRAVNMNGPHQFNIPSIGTQAKVDEDGNVITTTTNKVKVDKDAFGKPKGSSHTSETKTKKSRNGAIVKAIHDL